MGIPVVWVYRRSISVTFQKKTMIDVLLATYDGARWLPELLDSLLNQTEQRFMILARDDRSSDDTFQILRKFRSHHPGKLQIIEDDSGNLGVKGNFNRLMECSSAPYVMFCDQDDVWLPHKIAVTLEKMEELEGENRAGSPILVHTDLEVVDESLTTLDHSFWHYQNLDPRAGNQINRVLVQNVVTGCASMVNRSLVELASPIPGEAVMHDWWMALTAAAFGVVAALPVATVLYRQHDVNLLGAQGWNLRYVLRTARWVWDAQLLRDNVRRTMNQAHEFLGRYRKHLTVPTAELVSAWANLMEEGWLARRIRVMRYGFFKVGLVRNIGMFMQM